MVWLICRGVGWKGLINGTLFFFYKDLFDIFLTTPWTTRLKPFPKALTAMYNPVMMATGGMISNHIPILTAFFGQSEFTEKLVCSQSLRNQNNMAVFQYQTTDRIMSQKCRKKAVTCSFLFSLCFCWHFVALAFQMQRNEVDKICNKKGKPVTINFYWHC